MLYFHYFSSNVKYGRNTKHEAERWRLTPKQEELEKRLRTADLEIERLYRENHELKEQVKKHAPAISDLDKAIIN